MNGVSASGAYDAQDRIINYGARPVLVNYEVQLKIENQIAEYLNKVVAEDIELTYLWQPTFSQK